MCNETMAWTAAILSNGLSVQQDGGQLWYILNRIDLQIE